MRVYYLRAKFSKVVQENIFFSYMDFVLRIFNNILLLLKLSFLNRRIKFLNSRIRKIFSINIFKIFIMELQNGVAVNMGMHLSKKFLRVIFC